MTLVASFLALAAVALGPGMSAQPASAQEEDPPSAPCRDCESDVTPTDDGILGSVRSEIAELNSHRSNPIPCHGTDDPDEAGDPGIGEFDGHWRWRLTRNGNESWHETNDTDLQTGTYFRRECWSPAAGEFGDWQGELQLFPNITPQNLARVAMDDFFVGLGAPTPMFSPASPTMVSIDTWMWVPNIPTTRVYSEVIEVPGIRVQASAITSGVDWDMGDGTTIHCDDMGTPYAAGATSACTHRYQRSSADQSDAVYHGTATIVWTGTYTVNGTPAPEEFPIERITPFTLGVEEAQALNTDD